MQFMLICELLPTSAFGLPDGDVLVMPAPGGQMHGPAVHFKAGVRLGFGTLSQYRRLESRLETAFPLGDGTGRIVDNILEIRYEAPDGSTALEAGQSIACRFLQHLALEHGRPFNAVPSVLEDAAENPVPLPVVLWRGTITVYDIGALRQQVQGAAARVSVSDAVLDKALEYYEHALYLFTSAPAPTLPVTSRTAHHLVAGAFLFMWKSLSAVVGDPSSDRDYQRRYRELGLEYSFFHETIEEDPTSSERRGRRSLSPRFRRSGCGEAEVPNGKGSGQNGRRCLCRASSRWQSALRCRPKRESSSLSEVIL